MEISKKIFHPLGFFDNSVKQDLVSLTNDMPGPPFMLNQHMSGGFGLFLLSAFSKCAEIEAKMMSPKCWS